MTNNLKQAARRAQVRWLLTVYLPAIVMMLGTATAALWVIWLMLQANHP